MNRKKLIIIVALVAVAVGAFVLSLIYKAPEYESREIWGGIEEIRGKTMYVKGTFVKVNGADPINPESPVEMAIEITPETKIEKLVWHMLTMEELEKTGGRWNPNDLRKEVLPSSFEELLAESENYQGMGVRAEASRNIYGKGGFKATKIEYRVLFYSDW